MDVIISLNRDACILMATGDFYTAANILIEALKQFQFLNVQSQESEEMKEENQQSSHIHPVRIACKQSEGSSYYFYNWAFLVNDDPATPSFSQNKARVSAILLYNTGLCFQAVGLIQSNASVSLEKALKLYEMALSLLYFVNCADRLLRIALLNNKGCIMNAFHEYKETQACLGSLQYLLTNAELPRQARREDIVEIYMNVALHFGEHTHASAA